MSSNTLLIPPSLDLTRRRPSLSHGMSVRPSPYPNGPSSRPRPGMSRTYSFCASSSDQNYNSASSSSRPSIPFHRQRIPTPSSSKAKAGTQLVAPMMERSISTLGIDGLQMTQYDGGLPPSRCATPLTPRDSNVEVESPTSTGSVAVPCIIIDEATPKKTSRPNQRPNVQVDIEVGPVPTYSYPCETAAIHSPHSPAWSSQHSTPGPVTPNTPLGLRRDDHDPSVLRVNSPGSDMEVDEPAQLSERIQMTRKVAAE